MIYSRQFAPIFQNGSISKPSTVATEVRPIFVRQAADIDPCNPVSVRIHHGMGCITGGCKLARQKRARAANVSISRTFYFQFGNELFCNPDAIHPTRKVRISRVVTEYYSSQTRTPITAQRMSPVLSSHSNLSCLCPRVGRPNLRAVDRSSGPGSRPSSLNLISTR